jgi:tetratricopeptide (TPR) repeat protein
MQMKRALTVFFLVLAATPAFSADKWLSIRFKDFLVVGNAGESDIRRVGRSLEQFRSALGIMFPKIDQTAPVPVTVMVFKNDESFAPYKPLIQGTPANVVAFFQPGEEVNYIAVPPTGELPNVVLHEYVHLMLRDNVGSLPTWITEGLAECYSTFETGGKQNEFTIGRAPDRHLATLMDPAQFLPFKKLLSVQQNSPEYNAHSRQGIFYAESWAVVHYMILGPESKRKSQFVQLLMALTRGDPFDESFTEVFQTDYGTLEDEVREYIRKRTSWPVMKVTSKENLQVDARSAPTTTLSDGDTEFYLGDLLLHLNRLSDAEIHLVSAASKSAANSAAQTSLAILRVRQKKYDEALALLKKAVEADSKNPMVNFYYAYAMDRADADALAVVNSLPAERYEIMHSYVKKSIDLAPRFIEGYALLGRVNLNAGEHLDESETTLKKALSFAPGREDLRMLLAQTYLRAGRTADGRTVLSEIEHITTDPDMRRRVTALLDQSEQTTTFKEIAPAAERDLAVEPVEKDLAVEPAGAVQPPLPPRPASPKETILEALTPVGPDVAGEKVSGLLVNLECSDGLTLRVRSDKGMIDLHSAQPDKIQFLSYTSDVTDNVKCGPRNPGIPVTITYQTQTGALPEPLVVEFQEKK